MDQLTPIYRIEYFLDAVVNNSPNDLEPIYRVEFFLAKIAGRAVETPPPLSRMEMFLAQLCGESVTLPTPQSRTEQYLAAICGEDVEIPPYPVYRIEYWLAAWAEGGSEIVTVTGTAPLTLLDAVAHPIHSLKQYGLCVQDGTPTPSAPVDIVCNNGAIKLRRPSGMPIAYQMVEWIKSTGSITITGFKTKSTQEIETVFYRERSGASYLYSSDTATGGATNTTAYLTSGAGNWRWDGKSSSIGVSTGIKFTSVQNKDGVWLNDTRAGWYTDPGDFVSTNDLRLSSGENTTVRIYSMTIREGEQVTLDLVPVQRLSDSAYGFFDKVSGEFYSNPEATFTAGAPIDDPVEIYTDGTDEVLTVSGSGAETQTVTGIPMLLGVGGYNDEVELIQGIKTGKVGIVRLSPDWTWLKSSTYVGSFYTNDVAGVGKKANDPTALCTHGFQVNSLAEYSAAGVGAFYWYSVATINYKYDDGTATVEQFKKFLTDNAVLVLYPRATATTEQTTPHALHTSAGDNVVAVSAAVSPVQLSVEYAKQSA